MKVSRISLLLIIVGSHQALMSKQPNCPESIGEIINSSQPTKDRISEITKAISTWAKSKNNANCIVGGKIGSNLTLIAWAAYSGSSELVHKLFKLGANVNAMAIGGPTPLMAAASIGKLDIVKYLVEKGAKVNLLQDKNNWISAISTAASEGNLGIVKYLVEHGAKVNTTLGPLTAAASAGHLDIVKYLVENAKANVNAKMPLAQAIRSGHTNIVKYLLEHGANANMKGPQGQTPLVMVFSTPLVGKLAVEMINVLVEHGADVNTKNSSGNTVLLWAAQAGHLGSIKSLVKHGAHITFNDIDWALYKCNLEAVEYLASKANKKAFQEAHCPKKPAR